MSPGCKGSVLLQRRDVSDLLSKCTATLTILYSGYNFNPNSPSIQGNSKVEDPGQGLIGMRGEAPELASDVGNLMQIHQGEHDAVEHGQHLSHRREAHATTIFS